jgi:hypothetical protein
MDAEFDKENQVTPDGGEPTLAEKTSLRHVAECDMAQGSLLRESRFAAIRGDLVLLVEFGVHSLFVQPSGLVAMSSTDRQMETPAAYVSFCLESP